MKDFNKNIGSINDLKEDQIYDFLRYLISDEDFDISNDKILRLKGMIKSKSIVSITSTPSSEFSCTYDIEVRTNDGTKLSFNVLDNDLIKRALESTIYTLHSIDDVKNAFDNIFKIIEGITQYQMSIKTRSSYEKYVKSIKRYYDLVTFSSIIPLSDLDDAEKVINTIKELYDKLIQYSLCIKMNKEDSRKLSDLIHKSKIPTYRNTWFNNESDKGELSSEILDILDKLKE